MLEELKKKIFPIWSNLQGRNGFFGTKISDKEKKFDIYFVNTCNLACGKTE